MLPKDGKLHASFVDMLTDIVGEWNETDESYGDGLEHMHGVVTEATASASALDQTCRWLPLLPYLWRES